MKKYLIIGLVFIVLGALVVIPMLKSTPTVEEDEIPAVFAFNDNLATKWDETIQLEININQDDIAKLELIYNDSVFKTWNNPKDKIVFPFKAGYYGLGTREIQLLSTMKDGSTFVDNRNFIRRNGSKRAKYGCSS